MSIVEIDRVTKNFGKAQVLKNVSLTIEKGEFFGLLGPNGAGKTTLINILGGLVTADSGWVRINGFDTILAFKEARNSLGVVPQELVYDPFFNVRETLEFQSGYFGIRNNRIWIEEILENLGLTAQAEVNSRSLSGGMKRRLLIAQALVHRPSVIVLDEPTAGVDVELRQNLWKFIQRLNREGHTIILTTHYLEEAQALCDRVAIMRRGEIAILGTMKSLLDRFASRKLILRVRSGRLPSILQDRLCEGPSKSMELHRLDQKTQVGVGMSSNSCSPYDQKTSEGNFFYFRINRSEEIPWILEQCWLSGCKVDDLDIVKVDFEEVFLHVSSEGNMPSC